MERAFGIAHLLNQKIQKNAKERVLLLLNVLVGSLSLSVKKLCFLFVLRMSRNQSVLFTIGNVTLRLNLNGQTDKCAGAVEFQTHNSIIGVCDSNWGKKQHVYFRSAAIAYFNNRLISLWNQSIIQIFFFFTFLRYCD